MRESVKDQICDCIIPFVLYFFRVRLINRDLSGFKVRGAIVIIIESLIHRFRALSGEAKQLTKPQHHHDRCLLSAACEDSEPPKLHTG